ncbi:hypothetical protein DSN97_09200 [Deferribacteraceae bacterium V6Fe1]|nr:hypothetical protein DSN97_09200 [Deferribacteraceae bacterium V6Fe1]
MVKLFKNHFAIHKLKSITVFSEVIAFTLTAIFIGYIINKQNPLFVDSSYINYFFIIILVFALFHGLGAGLISLLIIAGFFYFYYNSKNSLNFFLDGLLLTLIAGEFHYYWTRKISMLNIKNDYLYSKIRELGISALTTKLSHDQLEKSYLSKPYTIRSILKELLSQNIVAYDDLLKFLSAQFKMEKFALVLYDSDKEIIKEIYPHNMDKGEISLKNPIIAKIFEKKEPVLLNDIAVKEEVNLLAAIPVLSNNDEIIAFLALKEMPFLHYNVENLISAQLILMNFFYNLNKSALMERAKEVELFANFPMDFKFELIKLNDLYKTIKISSSIVIFEISKSHSEIMENFLTLNLRVLDFYYKKELSNKDLFIVVLPLVSKEGTFGFVERAKNNLNFLSNKDLYNIFDISNIHNIDKFIKESEENV